MDGLMTLSSPKWVKAGGLGALLFVFVAAGSAGCERAESGAHAQAPSGRGPSSSIAADTSEPALSDIVQLTSGFDRAGEAYFSADTNWIVFQAAPAGQQHYDMYVARLKKQANQIVGLEQAVRISPDPSWNSCG